MATSLLYLGLCLGPYSILITPSLGGVCVCSYCSCCGCYRVAGAAIRVTSEAASGIGGACVDGACVNGAYIDGACIDGACTDKACTDGAYKDGACREACYGA